MKIRADQILPIGSIVLLKGGEKRLMVFGVDQVDLETEAPYDYSGVLYPEGSLGVESFFLFNHEDINEMHFFGYSDAERQEFVAELERVAAVDSQGPEEVQREEK